MQLVYNSPNFYIVEYPQQDGFEIVDKNQRMSGFITGDVAVRFREELMAVIDSHDNPEESLSALMLQFNDLMSLPAVLH